MVRLLLLLLGADYVRRQSVFLYCLGALLVIGGIAIGIDALDGKTLIRPRDFSIFLMLEGIVSLLAAFATVGMAQMLQGTKALLLIVIGVVIVFWPWHGNFLLAMAFGVAFGCDGVLRITSALLVRYEKWRAGLGLGIVQLGFAIFMVEPWPTRYAGTIGFNVGLGLLLFGASVLLAARRLHQVRSDAPLFLLFNRTLPQEAWPIGGDAAGGQELVVHVWTPAGSAKARSRRPLIDRYIAAVDTEGTISTGHAAMELPPDLYISHYPATEIDRSPEDFTRVLRATHDNDVAGRFQPSYAIEAAGWCDSTRQVRFRRFDAARLRAFWAGYRKDTTYNLTSRNCTTVVAQALDVALEGVIGRQPAPLWQVLRILLSPELWVATQMRKRAESMAWTPGLMLDYVRALRALVEPRPATWRVLIRRLARRRQVSQVYRRRSASPTTSSNIIEYTENFNK